MYVFHCWSLDQKCSLPGEGIIWQWFALGTLMVPIWDLLGFRLRNIIYYCPGCSKSFASVGSVKNLLSCSGTHSKGLSSVRRSGPVLTVPELKAARDVRWFDSMCASLSSLASGHSWTMLLMCLSASHVDHKWEASSVVPCSSQPLAFVLHNWWLDKNVVVVQAGDFRSQIGAKLIYPKYSKHWPYMLNLV